LLYILEQEGKTKMTDKLIHKGWFNIAVAAVWLLTYFASRAALESAGLGQTARIIVALVPAVPFAFFLWLFIRNIGQMDEMERRIQMEAMAFAFPMSIFLLMVLGLLQLAVELSPEDWSYRHVWAFLPFFYFAEDEASGIACGARVVAGRAGRAAWSFAADDQRH
jgi:hypothetical protein